MESKSSTRRRANKPEIRSEDVTGLKYFDRLERLHDDGCQRDATSNGVATAQALGRLGDSDTALKALNKELKTVGEKQYAKLYIEQTIKYLRPDHQATESNK